jgi:hypothetical protein
VSFFIIVNKEAPVYTSIDIDFDVFKALTTRRATPETTENDILRELLGLESGEDTDSKNTCQTLSGSVPANSSKLENNEVSTSTGFPWVWKGVSFPHGTEFRASHRGRYYYASVNNGALVYGGNRYKAPSTAGTAITGTSVNGWRFWKCKLPGERNWVLMDKMRVVIS